MKINNSYLTGILLYLIIESVILMIILLALFYSEIFRGPHGYFGLIVLTTNPIWQYLYVYPIRNKLLHSGKEKTAKGLFFTAIIIPFVISIIYIVNNYC